MLMEMPFAKTLARDPIRKDRKLHYKRFQGHSDFRSPRQKGGKSQQKRIRKQRILILFKQASSSTCVLTHA